MSTSGDQVMHERNLQGPRPIPASDGVADVELERRRALADFLQAQRLATRPEDLGLVPGPRRRVRGLRREEVANLAAVSVTWYTWLEQARDVRATPQVLDSIARAMQLDEVAHRHLRRLGGYPVTTSPTFTASCPTFEQPVPWTLRGLVDDALPCPATLMRPNSDLVAWNDAFSALWGDPRDLSPQRRNGLIMLMSERVRPWLVDWESLCEQAVANFRAEAAKHLGDEGFTAVIATLSSTSEVFRSLWEGHTVRRMVDVRCVYRHPAVGQITVEQVGLRPMGAPSLILVVHRLVDEVSRARMAALLGQTHRVSSLMQL